MVSYTVFARKYRPQKFEDVLGQEHITQTLRNAIDQNRIAHAYIFVGPRGTGKTSTARIFAMALNATNGPKADFDPEDDICKEIAQGRSLDVIEIDGASNNGVEQVRELRENVRFAPARGKFKIYIIDEVHMLTTAAFNALLKTLEEPPAHAKFLMATTDVQKVLPTILSRCQRFDLRRIPTATIARHLLWIAAQEGFTLDIDAAATVARGAEGGLRDAESMLDQLVAFCGSHITEADVLSVFGFTAAEAVFGLTDAILDGDASGALHAVHGHAEAGRDLGRLMSDLISHIRNLLVLKADADGLGEEVMPEAIAKLQAQADRATMDKLLDLIEGFAAAEGRMKWAPNKKMHFEVAVIRAIQTLQSATLTEVLDTLTAIRGGTPPPQAPKPVPRPAQRAITQPATPQVKIAPVEKPAEPQKPVVPAKPAEIAKPEPEPVKTPVAAPVVEVVVPPPPETPEPVVNSPVPVAPKAEPPAPSPKAVPIANFWQAFLDTIKRDRALIVGLVRGGVFIGNEGGILTIAFPPEQSFAKEMLDTHVSFMAEVASKLNGAPTKVRLEVREGVVATPVVVDNRDPMDIFKDDPKIRRVLELFQGTLQPG